MSTIHSAANVEAKAAEVSQQLVLQVHCRDFSSKIRVGFGEQNFKWLANVVRDKYVARFPQYHAEQFTPILVHDKVNRPLLPHLTIAEHVHQDEDVYIQLIGPNQSLANPSRPSSERSLWELFAYEPPYSLTPVTFFFDANEVADLQGNTVGVFGSFNSWSMPIVMKEVQPHLFAETIYLPEGAEICFKFVLNDKHVVSPYFEVVLNEEGVEMNYAKIKKQPTQVLVPGYEPSAIRRGTAVEAASRPPPGLSASFHGKVDPIYAHNIEAPPLDARFLAGTGMARGGGLGRLENPPLGGVAIAVPLRRAPRSITGVFEGVRQLSPEMQRRLFDSDWSRMRISDLIRDPSERKAVKESLWGANEFLRRLFRGVTSQSGHDAAQMSVVTLAHLLHLCGISDKFIAEAGLSRVLSKVGMTEAEVVAQAQAEEEAAAAAAASHGGLAGWANAPRSVGATNSATSNVANSSMPQPSNFTSLGSQPTDPFYVENKLTRAQFYELLVLLAFSFSPSSTPQAAVQSFLETRILPFAIPSPKRTDLRARLLDPLVQKRIDQLKTRLWYIFSNVSTQVRAVSQHGQSSASAQPSAPSASGKPSSSSSSSDSNSGKKPVYMIRVMDENLFRAFLQEYSLHDHHKLRLPALTNALHQSVALDEPSTPDLSDSMNEVESTSVAASGVSQLGAMSTLVEIAFPEFIELLARMCELKYGPATSAPLIDKLNTFLDPILQHKVENR